VVDNTARSQCLIQWDSVASGFSGRFTCPDGHITLVKAFTIYNPTLTEANVSLIVQNAGFGVGVYPVREVLASLAAKHFDFWVVLNPGDSCIIACDIDGVGCWVSGAVLVGGNRFPPATRAEADQVPR